MKRQPKAEQPGFIRQIEAAEKVLSFAKMLLAAFAAVLLWAARLQWNVADLQRQVTDIAATVKDVQEDRRTRIKDAEAWRRQVDLDNRDRDNQLKQLTDIAKTLAEKSSRPR